VLSHRLRHAEDLFHVVRVDLRDTLPAFAELLEAAEHLPCVRQQGRRVLLGSLLLDLFELRPRLLAKALHRGQPGVRRKPRTQEEHYVPFRHVKSLSVPGRVVVPHPRANTNTQGVELWPCRRLGSPRRAFYPFRRLSQAASSFTHRPGCSSADKAAHGWRDRGVCRGPSLPRGGHVQARTARLAAAGCRGRGVCGHVQATWQKMQSSIFVPF